MLNWSAIQPQVEFGKGDFLIILDCCYEAQAASAPEDRVIPQNVEVLAAAPMECYKAASGPHSFTTAFIKDVENAFAHEGKVKIRDIHHRLTTRDQPFNQLPTYFGDGTKATICLEPLANSQLSSESILDPATTLMHAAYESQ